LFLLIFKNVNLISLSKTLDVLKIFFYDINNLSENQISIMPKDLIPKSLKILRELTISFEYQFR